MDIVRVRREGIDRLTPSLKTLVGNSRCDLDDRSIDPCWERWIQRRDQAAFRQLMEFYSPFLAMSVTRLMKRHRGYLSDEFSTYFSDAALTLAKMIRNQRKPFDPRHWKVMLWKYIPLGVQAELDARSFVGRSGRSDRRIVARIKCELTARLGREATRDELEAAIRQARGGKFDRLLSIVGTDEKSTRAFSQFENDGRHGIDPLDASAADPGLRMMNAEAMKLAFRILKKDERPLIQAMLDGKTGEQMTIRFWVSRERIRQRLNVALWRLRCNRKLAEHFGVQPDAETPLDPRGRPLNFPAKPPPAPVAA
jgi:hypothetical protein